MSDIVYHLDLIFWRQGLKLKPELTNWLDRLNLNVHLFNKHQDINSCLSANHFFFSSYLSLVYPMRKHLCCALSCFVRSRPLQSLRNCPIYCHPFLRAASALSLQPSQGLKSSDFPFNNHPLLTIPMMCYPPKLREKQKRALQFFPKMSLDPCKTS